MIVLADKVKDLLEKLRFENNGELNGNSIDVVYDFIKNYPTIINESNLYNDFCEGLEERLKRKLTEDEIKHIFENADHYVKNGRYFKENLKEIK